MQRLEDVKGVVGVMGAELGVVVLPTLAVRRKRELYGFCFTPQDGNSLLSSVAAALWLIEPDQESVSKRLEPLRRFMYQEI